MTQELSNKFRNMSFIAACMVVLIHVVHAIPPDCSRTMFWFLRMTKEGVCRIAVPFFFFAAGYFLARHIGEEGWWRTALRKRMHSLVVPYLAFNVYAWVFALLVAAMNHTVQEYLGTNVLTHVAHILGLEVATPAYGITWFIRALLVLVVLSLLIVPCMRKKRFGIVFLSLMLILRLLQDAIAPDSNWSKFFLFVLSLEGLFFFSMGMFFRMHNIELMSSRPLVNFLLVAAGIFAFWLENAYALPCAHIVGILLTLCGVWGGCPQRHGQRVSSARRLPSTCCILLSYPTFILPSRPSTGRGGLVKMSLIIW